MTPVELSIFVNRVGAICLEMGAVLERSSLSPNIKDRLDFSCALFDECGRLVSNAPHMPVHLGSMGESVRSVIDNLGETLSPGDAVMLNSPYNGGTHLPDITVVTPWFDNSDSVQFFLASRAPLVCPPGRTSSARASSPPRSPRQPDLPKPSASGPLGGGPGRMA